MIGLAFILFAAALASGLARGFRWPLIPLYLIAGMLLPVVQDWGLVLVEWLPEAVGSFVAAHQGDDFVALEKAILELGLAFLVFAVGLDLNPQRAGERKKAVLYVGAGQFFVLGGAGFLAGLALGYPSTVAVFLGLVLAASSTLVVVRHLKQQQKLFTRGGRLVTGVLVLQDLLVIIGLVVLLRLSDGFGAIALGIGGMLLLAACSWLAARYVIPRLVLQSSLGEELLLLSVLTILTFFMGLTYALGLPVIAGAFMAGLALSTFPVNGVVRGLINSLNDFFLALFFLVLGATIGWPSLDLFLTGIVFLALLLIVTPILVKTVAEMNGFSSRSAVESGLLLAQTSEFSLIIALYAAHPEGGQLITQEMFSLIALLTVFSMALTPVISSTPVVDRLIKLSPVSRWRARQADFRQSGKEFSDHIIMAGIGEAGFRLIRQIQRAGTEVVVIEEDGALLQQLQEKEIPFVRGDFTSPATLEEAGLTRARAIVSTAAREDENHALMEALGPHSLPLVLLVPDQRAAERCPPHPNLYPLPIANRTAERFFEWFNLTLATKSETPEEGR